MEDIKGGIVMANLKFRLIKEGVGPKGGVPLNIAFIDIRDIKEAGITIEHAFNAISKEVNGPIGMNVFDMDAVTTTSDGIAVDGAIIAMAAGDIGKVHKEFGILYMEEIPVTDELISEEPHLIQLVKNYQGKRLFRGPDPRKKLIPVHNAVMTGKAVNNNSATEMMNAVTMKEIILPILGQIQIMRDGPILFGYTGEVISVGIGMTVAEKYGRVFPTRQFRAGDTAHGSGQYAKTLKKNIPCIVASKAILAKYTIQALKAGMVPGKDIGCSPAVLCIAKAMGVPIAFDNITEKAWVELESVGITREFLKAKSRVLTEDEIIERSDEIVPGVEEPVAMSSMDIVEKVEIFV
ncbi:hypothetical protein EDD71_10582 [Fonticella tunisiensis]|uniref:Uncharacterized protein n=2 Tax=Fonticella tunisiensis TaxID=1096341 RepID=A0A4R7KRD0_9CLOT|nr:hypothetical protein EDD71_10582 [Fonticella tunisiensis]